MGFPFSYELVRYTDKHDEYLIAMGSPASLMWVARLLVERFTIHDVSDDGLITFYWKFRKLESTNGPYFLHIHVVVVNPPSFCQWKLWNENGNFG